MFCNIETLMVYNIKIIRLNIIKKFYYYYYQEKYKKKFNINRIKPCQAYYLY